MGRIKRPEGRDPEAARVYVCETLEKLMNLGRKRCTVSELKLKLESLAWYAMLNGVSLPKSLQDVLPEIEKLPEKAPPSPALPDSPEIAVPEPTDEDLNGSL